ncbi:Class I SAM-dependent methyltransferase [Rhodovastum atsumiense]|uniref:Class I SAM-dependent methyltransferase n=1 Tax=Rhodovastum atsumiense TaxID=504468 RepID=A0A5M6IKT0_9PROT|nr:class I SAM-dependent methyltransferase [Rhodovastum atsumiense]KAA5608178.1 class I SAM-dependent methyltransferase [Rhodovastum atsumiense]CAH2602544.1 Class I SAM-dependent methyltransferase [Rhodovastum atsumiense]
MQDIIDGYAAAATPGLIARFDGLVPEQVYAPVLDLLPLAPARIADIGAGTGRDAAWFAGQGHRVLAVEPVRELREAGLARHGAAGIEWLDDRLPLLAKAREHGPFDLVVLCGVWQHLDDAARALAMDSLARLAAAGGRVILSLRHGPGSAGRRVFPVVPDRTIAAAARSGFTLLRRREADSIQPENRAQGVRWTWLALARRGPATGQEGH